MTWGCVALLSDSRRRFKNMKLKNRNNWNEENFIFDRYRRSQKRSVICDSIFSRFCCRRFVFKIRDRFVWRLWQLCCFFRRKPRTRPLKSFEANTFKHFFEISNGTKQNVETEREREREREREGHWRCVVLLCSHFLSLSHTLTLYIFSLSLSLNLVSDAPVSMMLLLRETETSRVSDASMKERERESLRAKER